MPRPAVIIANSTASRLVVDGTRPPEVHALKLTQPEVERRLRVRRSAAYLKAMTQLDAGVHHADAAAFQTLMGALRAEFPELRASDLPLGIVAQCYLGEPHEVHTLDWTGKILRHYKRHEPLPPAFERARSLALHPNYAFVEVYIATLRPVLVDGEVVVLTNNSCDHV